MVLIHFIIELMAGVMMMLMAINMVRSGVKKSYGGMIAGMLSTRHGSWHAVLLGVILAIAMQGATAVIVLTAGLVGTSIIPLVVALCVAIGADLGSAIVLRILTFDISGFIPVLLASGGWLYLKSDRPYRNNIGQILFGIGLIILSLQLLKNAVQPVGTLPLFVDIAYYFETDLLLAFMMGAVLAFAMHSSVASILTLVTLVHVGTLSAVPGVAFILGANLGSGFIAYWLTRHGEPQEIILPKMIMWLRGLMAIIGVFVLICIEKYAPSDMRSYIYDLQEQSLIYTHVAFNALLLIWVPFASQIVDRFSPHIQQESTNENNGIFSMAQKSNLEGRTIVGFVSKEVISILDILAHSVNKTEEAYRSYNENIIVDVQDAHEKILYKVNELKKSYAEIPENILTPEQSRDIREYISYAIRLSNASETIYDDFMHLASDKYKNKVLFSEKGWQEMKDMYEQLRLGTVLMFDYITGNHNNAYQEMHKQKQIMQKNYHKSFDRHLKRLHKGNSLTTHSSDMHLKTVSYLNDIHNAVLSLSIKDEYFK